MVGLLRIVVGAALALLSLAPCVLAADDTRVAAKPNILLIVGDDMGYADVGFHGCHDIPTPHLDALAASGVRFTNGYVSGPYCSPTRAGLLTGRYQQRFGHEFNPGARQGLPLRERTLADRLKAAGYVTGLVGKWHLGSLPEMHPQRRGFDEFYGFLGGAHDYFKPDGILRGVKPVDDLDYTTDAFGREAVDFIQRHRDRPWFLYLAFNAVHTPMQATDGRIGKFADIADPRRRTYDAMMLAMDEAIGRVRKTLADTGLEPNTLVALLSDNGGPTMAGTTVNGSRNNPLRGSKRTTLEGGVRVPFLVAWPGRLNPGVFHQAVIQLDLHATVLAAAGIEVQPQWSLDGVNLLPFLDGTKSGMPHDTLYWRFGAQMAIRAGDFKLVRYDSNADTLTGVRNQPVTGPRLYNLADDIGETKDLAGEMPEKMAELQAKWDAWNATLVEPRWGGNTANRGPAEVSDPAKSSTSVLPRFHQQVITRSIKFGYQLVGSDLNGDGKKDLIAVDERATELAWFENPSWMRHVLAVDVPRPLNTDAWDIDADGIPEIALAYRFESSPGKSVGNLALLKAGPDVCKPWTTREIDRVPTAHRVRWIDPEGTGQKVLLLGPMVGLRYPPQQGDRVPIYLYRPADWKRETISTEPGGVLHAIYPVSWDGSPRQQLLTASHLGLHRLEPTESGWKATHLHAGDSRPWPLCGTSEVRLGHLDHNRFLATIEPWHGNQVVVYIPDDGQWMRTVIEDQMQNGHALAVGDLNKDGRDEIVSGFRGTGCQLSIYQAADPRGKRWQKTVLDDGGIAAADCVVEDFTGDSRPDIACIGASTGNVKLYENRGF